jgi:hypothetical protein
VEITVRNKVPSENIIAKTLLLTSIPIKPKGTIFFGNFLLGKKVPVEIRAINNVPLGFPGENY